MMRQIIIAGGGMTGATLALALSALSRGELAIDLVEAHFPARQEHPGFDARAIALAHGTCQQLKHIGIWSALAKHATAIESVHVSDRGHAGFVTLEAMDYQVSALGQVIELHQAGQSLFRLLAEAPGVRLHCPASVIDVRRSQKQVEAILDTGQTLTGQLLVAADGSFSPLAQACGMCWQSHDYQQVAVIANVLTSEPHNGRAFERFTCDGPLALLPMSDGRSSLVWCHDRENQSWVDGWDDTTFLQQLQQTFGWRLGQFEQVGQRNIYPLVLRTAERHVTHRLALVGNAAQTLHPIAGQGFNLGLRDVMSLAETMTTALQQGEDLGSYAVLGRYFRRREADQRATVGLTEGLIHLFANQHDPLVAGRNFGLMLMDRQPWLRTALARRMLGWVER